MKARPFGWSVIALCALFVGTAAAAPPPHAGGGKGGPPAHAGGGNGKGGGAHGKSDHSKSDRGPSDRGGRDDARHGEIRFHDDHRIIVRDYRSEEHTSELQSLMRISYAVFCLKKKKRQSQTIIHRANSTDKQSERSKARRVILHRISLADQDSCK